jgi:DNA-binding NarL/FixJ family response regulator
MRTLSISIPAEIAALLDAAHPKGADAALRAAVLAYLKTPKPGPGRPRNPALEARNLAILQALDSGKTVGAVAGEFRLSVCRVNQIKATRAP